MLRLVQFLKSGLMWRLGCVIGGVSIGVGSAYFAMTNLGVTKVQGNPGWETRELAPSGTAVPYVLGYFLAAGQLPPPASVMQFNGVTDSSDAKFSGSCIVKIEGMVPDSRWWTLAAVDFNGLTQNERSVVTAGTAIRETDGRLVVFVSRTPHHGNWLIPPSSGRYHIALTLHDASQTRDAGFALPKISIELCP